MSYEQKGVWVYLTVSVAAFAVYAGIILSRAGDAPIADVDYVSTLLWMIGISIGATIVARVAVETARPSDSYRSDERDRSMNRRGEHVGGIVLAVGMVVPLGLALAEADYFWIANAIYLVFTLQAVAASITTLVAYHRGVQTW